MKGNNRNNKYECNECKMMYKDKNLAEKCEKWCKKHKSCNLEIIKNALPMKGGKT